MKLYLLEQDENQSEGSIVSCVVVASSKESAQKVHPFSDWDRVEVWTYDSEDVKVTYLGNARKDLEKCKQCCMSSQMLQLRSIKW